MCTHQLPIVPFNASPAAATDIIQAGAPEGLGFWTWVEIDVNDCVGIPGP